MSQKESRVLLIIAAVIVFIIAVSIVSWKIALNKESKIYEDAYRSGYTAATQTLDDRLNVLQSDDYGVPKSTWNGENELIYSEELYGYLTDTYGVDMVDELKDEVEAGGMSVDMSDYLDGFSSNLSDEVSERMTSNYEIAQNCKYYLHRPESDY